MKAKNMIALSSTMEQHSHIQTAPLTNEEKEAQSRKGASGGDCCKLATK